MTTTTRYGMTCECGHRGNIKMRENDQPYSQPWEKYSLEGFNGGGHSVDGFASLDEAIEAMNPTCPHCDRRLTKDNLD